ncbi:hypothetical protein KHQ81_05630 [Mycoplasmatota bacterium]|nr:hypothetical protein KHQ81_05630 [Mycoplasmatota bacterium]
MQKKIINKNGASLIEIVATITIVSIALIMIYNILSYNIRQNGINHERIMNANIANGTLSYIINKDFSIIENHLKSNTDHYAIIDENSCNALFSDDLETCMAVLSPVINSKEYHSDNLYIYLLPFNDPIAINELKSTPPPNAPQVLIDYLDNLDTSQFTEANVNHNAIRVIVITESSINSKYDFLLKGVTTK